MTSWLEPVKRPRLGCNTVKCKMVHWPGFGACFVPWLPEASISFRCIDDVCRSVPRSLKAQLRQPFPVEGEGDRWLGITGFELVHV